MNRLAQSLFFLVLPIWGLSGMVMADTYQDCGEVNISRIYAQGTHSHEHNNKMIIIFSDANSTDASCDFTHAWIANTDDAHDAMLSIILASHFAGANVRVGVDSADLKAGAARLTNVNTM